MSSRSTSRLYVGVIGGYADGAGADRARRALIHAGDHTRQARFGRRISLEVITIRSPDDPLLGLTDLALALLDRQSSVALVEAPERIGIASLIAAGDPPLASRAGPRAIGVTLSATGTVFGAFRGRVFAGEYCARMPLRSHEEPNASRISGARARRANDTAFASLLAARGFNCVGTAAEKRAAGDGPSALPTPVIWERSQRRFDVICRIDLSRLSYPGAPHPLIRGLVHAASQRAADPLIGG